MEARRRNSAGMAVPSGLVLVALSATAGILPAATYETPNFTIHAPSGQLAKQLGDAAEVFRRDLALEWLGYELPQWKEKCPVHARIDRGAGGETSFSFTRGQVHGWRMLIQGSPERMLDSVLPHEVTHTIFATHFRGPLPRWADEGACTTVEHPGEVARMERELIRFLKTRRGIRFSDMMWMKQYPSDFMPLYAQGHSVAQYLINQRGKQAFVKFLEDGLRDDNWPRAAHKHYGFANLAQMQDQWLDWVRAGRPVQNAEQDATTMLASSTTVVPSGPAAASPPEPVEPSVIRGQSPDVPLRGLVAASPPSPPLVGAAPASAASSSIHSIASRGAVIFEWRAEEDASGVASALRPSAE